MVEFTLFAAALKALNSNIRQALHMIEKMCLAIAEGVNLSPHQLRHRRIYRP